MNPGRLLAAATIAGLAAMAAIPASAPATLRVESTAQAGLVLRDVEGTSTDDVRLTRHSAEQWQVASFSGFFSLDIGPGCRGTDLVFGRFAECDRLAPNVSVNLLGGDDTFLIQSDTQPITDPLTINFGAGNDRFSKFSDDPDPDRNDGSDTIQGLSLIHI